MKKEDFIKSVESIQPEAHIKSRLKAKVTAREHKRKVSLTKTVTALCLAAAVAFGIGAMIKPDFSGGEGSSEITASKDIPDIMKSFIIVAAAADSQGDTAEGKTLELNEEYPCGVHLQVVDIRGISDSEKKAALKEMNNELAKHCADSSFSKGRSYTVCNESYYLSQCSLNEFKLDLQDSQNIKCVNVKNSSPYGQLVYSVNKPTFNAPEHGNSITVSGDKFDCKTAGFYWDHTEEMEKALDADVNTPFSLFNDTITFTVEYNDGTKAVAVIDIIFNADGGATAVCTSSVYKK